MLPEAVPTTGGAFRLSSMADPDYSWHRPRLARRSSVIGFGTRDMNLNTVTELSHPTSAAEIADWRNGFAWLAGGTWLFSEPQPATDTLIDLGNLGWPAIEVSSAGLDIRTT